MGEINDTDTGVNCTGGIGCTVIPISLADLLEQHLIVHDIEGLRVEVKCPLWWKTCFRSDTGTGTPHENQCSELLTNPSQLNGLLTGGRNVVRGDGPKLSRIHGGRLRLIGSPR